MKKSQNFQKLSEVVMPARSILLSGVLLIITTTLYANETLEAIFADRYFSAYEEDRCGKNSMELIRTAAEAGVDPQSLFLIHIRHRGQTEWDRVNAERARTIRFGRIEFGETNWGFHVVVMDSNGTVYDASFENAPRPLHMDDYLEEMFLIEDECDNPRPYVEKCVGREKKLKDYLIISVRGKDVIANTPHPVELKHTMRDVRNDWRVLIQF
jgi:hypothetical protein